MGARALQARDRRGRVRRCLAGTVAAALVVSGAGGTTSASAVSTTGADAPISVTRPLVHSIGGALIGEPDPVAQAYLTTSITSLPGVHHYRITITNTSNIGFIDTFEWH